MMEVHLIAGTRRKSYTGAGLFPPAGKCEDGAGVRLRRAASRDAGPGVWCLVHPAGGGPGFNADGPRSQRSHSTPA